MVPACPPNDFAQHRNGAAPARAPLVVKEIEGTKGLVDNPPGKVRFGDLDHLLDHPPSTGPNVQVQPGDGRDGLLDICAFTMFGGRSLAQI